MIADPINLMDSSPICDGAAAVVLVSEDYARALRNGRRPVRIAASAVATDSLAVHDRRDPLWLEAACDQQPQGLPAGRRHPSTTSTCSSCTTPSPSWRRCRWRPAASPSGAAACAWPRKGEITIEGRVPIATMGGLKARGHPVGATGVYQVVEATLQLQGLAGPQPGARRQHRDDAEHRRQRRDDR